MVSLLNVLPPAWQALCKATCSSDQRQSDALRSLSIHAASHQSKQLPSLGWMAPLLNLGQQSGPRLMAAWQTCMRKVKLQMTAAISAVNIVRIAPRHLLCASRALQGKLSEIAPGYLSMHNIADVSQAWQSFQELLGKHL